MIPYRFGCVYSNNCCKKIDFGSLRVQPKTFSTYFYCGWNLELPLYVQDQTAIKNSIGKEEQQPNYEVVSYSRKIYPSNYSFFQTSLLILLNDFQASRNYLKLKKKMCEFRARFVVNNLLLYTFHLCDVGAATFEFPCFILFYLFYGFNHTVCYLFINKYFNCTILYTCLLIENTTAVNLIYKNLQSINK